MRITIKKLETGFFIVYLLVAFVCIWCGLDCLVSSFFGFLVAVFDWFLIKLWVKRFMKKGRFSFFENFVRYLIVGLTLLILFEVGLNPLGIVVGISTIPLTLVGFTLFAVMTGEA